MKFSELFTPEVDETPELTHMIFLEKIRALRDSGKPETEYDKDELFLLITAKGVVFGRPFVGAKNNAKFQCEDVERARKLFVTEKPTESKYDMNEALCEAFKKELSQR